MGKSNFAVFVDLENAGGKEAMLRYIIEKVKIRGDILLGKVYGYTDRYSDLKQVLLSNTFNVVPSLRYGKNQKNNLDIQLVIDAMEVAYVNPLIDSFCIVSGDSDYTPLVGKLKSMGKFVLGISRSEAASNIFINACNEFVFLENVAANKPTKSKAKEDRAAEGDLQRTDQHGGNHFGRSGQRADLRQRIEGHPHPPAAGFQRAFLRLFHLRKAHDPHGRPVSAAASVDGGLFFDAFPDQSR